MKYTVEINGAQLVETLAAFDHIANQNITFSCRYTLQNGNMKRIDAPIADQINNSIITDPDMIDQFNKTFTEKAMSSLAGVAFVI